MATRGWIGILLLTASTPGGDRLVVEDSPSAPPAEVIEHGVRRRTNVEAPVVVDGRLVAQLRFGELPSIAVHASPLDSRPKYRYYALAEYLAAVGVDVARVRAVHVGGNGHRYASIEGDELRKQPERFLFDFRLETSGIPRTAWWTTGLRSTFRVDEIRSVLVYVDRDVPSLHARRSCYLEADGTRCSESLPYFDGDVPKGTRIYRDGKLVGTLKRRSLGDDLVVERRDGVVHYALDRLLEGSGVAPDAARVVQLVSGDDVVARTSGDALRRARTTFVLPKQSHGRALVHLPDADRDAEVTAIVVRSEDGKETRR